MRYLLLLPLLAGCSALNVDAEYVKADRATYDLVAPIVRDLADTDPTNDPDLTGVNGRAVISALDSWQLRLEKAEQ